MGVVLAEDAFKIVHYFLRIGFGRQVFDSYFFRVNDNTPVFIAESQDGHFLIVSGGFDCLCPDGNGGSDITGKINDGTRHTAAGSLSTALAGDNGDFIVI